MKVVLATVADFARSDVGTLNMLGARWIVSFEALNQRAAVFTLVVVIAADKDDDYEAKRQVEIEVLSPTGKSFLGPFPGEFEFPRPDEDGGVTTVMFITTAGGLQFTETGRYSVFVRHQGVVIYETLFGVVIKKAVNG